MMATDEFAFPIVVNLTIFCVSVHTDSHLNKLKFQQRYHGEQALISIQPGPLARSDECQPGNQTFKGSIPDPAHSFVEIWS